MQGCFALGNMIGPGIGAIFYEMGGFGLPFFIIGGLNMALSIALVVSIPNLSKINTCDNLDNENKNLVDKNSGSSKSNLGLVDYTIGYLSKSIYINDDDE